MTVVTRCDRLAVPPRPPLLAFLSSHPNGSNDVLSNDCERAYGMISEVVKWTRSEARSEARSEDTVCRICSGGFKIAFVCTHTYRTSRTSPVPLRGGAIKVRLPELASTWMTSVVVTKIVRDKPLLCLHTDYRPLEKPTDSLQIQTKVAATVAAVAAQHGSHILTQGTKRSLCDGS
jgi:hypothetical protein